MDHFAFGLSFVALALIAGHWAPWQQDMSRIQAYTYGLGAYLIGITIWQGLDGNWWIVAGLWAMAAVAGLVTVGAYGIDTVLNWRQRAK